MKHLHTLAAILVLFPLGLVGSCASTSSGPIEESFVQTDDGVLLSYRKVGSGPDVLIVPGQSVLADDLGWLADDRTVIFYDARGRGRSSATMTLDLEEDIADLETLRAWFDVERFSVLAVDYYVAVASLYAARHPERVDKLVLVSPLPLRKSPFWNIYERAYNDRRDSDAVRRLSEEKRDGLALRDPDAWVREFKNAMYRPWVIDQSDLDRMRSNPWVAPNANPETVMRKYMGLLFGLGDWDWSSEIANASAAALVLRGASDPLPLKAAEEWARAIPDGRVQVIDGSARLPWIEERRAFQRAVERFLE